MVRSPRPRGRPGSPRPPGNRALRQRHAVEAFHEARLAVGEAPEAPSARLSIGKLLGARPAIGIGVHDADEADAVGTQLRSGSEHLVTGLRPAHRLLRISRCSSGRAVRYGSRLRGPFPGPSGEQEVAREARSRAAPGSARLGCPRYSVLGWGGYWGWDPVENASLMPWLTGTAFLHSVMMQEKRGMLKTWNVWLIFITFMLSIFGTLLTRSGLVSSVHAFAQSSIGDWFVIFLAIILSSVYFST